MDVMADGYFKFLGIDPLTGLSFAETIDELKLQGMF
jgi:hypothetical protein